ncbi:MAG: zinc-binding dehydrogenase [Cohaesibacteraceae bacterium]
MKALYFEKHGGPDVMVWGELPTPEPEPGWVLLRVRAASLNYLDVFTRNGMPGIRVPFPMVTGGDCVGEIVASNGSLERLSIGDRALVNPAHIDDQTGHFEMLGETRPGALAEYVTARAKQLIPIPDGVSDQDAAALPVAYGTAWRMLVTRGAVTADDHVLILGASGGVGTAALLIAKGLGAKVTVGAGSKDKCDRLIALGADAAFNYSTEDIDAYAKRVTGSLFRGGGFDVVVNFTGGDTWVPSLKSVKRHGRLLTCGATAGYDPQTDIRYIFMAEMDIRGSTGFSRDDIVTCLNQVASGALKPHIGAVLPLSRAAEGISMLEERTVFGKIVITAEDASR